MTPGSTRIAFSRYTEELEVTAFKNPDGRLVFVVFNKTEKALPVTVRVGDETASFTAAHFSITTGIIAQK
ncbi:glycoside hydrolase family 30 beta sandwich domain-containing protein [Kineothrix sp. MB12-C1]|uniref:glycoside hydrolase family 30 beta sandwich domain-containing protein n=1 Tax=Kineothrix sp. MB12-C1 TaxID=3070215 RepID=UPI0027D326FE|nr:glycoside hydrolase family 30 beta sandwich domain-containing protein [Kineothrix sp. MB12-C1]WMC94505.1 glycoside hydrolase family 30 beta sandwich domain-containing protein [Kineothrix sp. MB12-C1]